LTKTQTHSKAKLALAILTSPSAAFEEITQRKLLGTALLIVAITGLISTIGGIARGAIYGPALYLALGKDNPLTWIGLCLLYALALKYLLKWLSTELDYVTAIVILGWSHVILLIHQAAGIGYDLALLANHPNITAIQILNALGLFLPIWFVLTIGIGLQTVYRMPRLRGVMSYMVVLIVFTMGFDMSYAQAHIAPFQNALHGIQTAVGELEAVASNPATMFANPWLHSADQVPRLAASVIGLILGLWQMGKCFGWDADLSKKRLISAGIIGALAIGTYTAIIHKTNYYNRFATAQRLYNSDKPEQAADAMVSLMPVIKQNYPLMLDAANTYYLAGDFEQSAKWYGEYERSISKDVRDESGTGPKMALSLAYTGYGSIADARGQYDDAIKEFSRATKAWPEFKDPWVRMAITFDRMGKYEDAIRAGNHAVKKLDSKAPLVWVALAQAFTRTGDKTQANAAIAMVTGLNADLCKRIASKTDDWSNAVSKLTREDLKFPLEKDLVAETKKPVKKKK